MADEVKTPKLTFDAFQGALDANDFADALNTIAEQIRDGMIAGDAGGCGWWSVEGLTERTVYDFRVAHDGTVVVFAEAGEDSEEIIFTAWDDTVETQTLMESMAEELNDGATPDYVVKRMTDHLTQLRLTRLGYKWSDDWETGQQRWTLKGPDGETIRLPSGGSHGWSECVTVATRDAYVKGLPEHPEEDYQP